MLTDYADFNPASSCLMIGKVPLKTFENELAALPCLHHEAAASAVQTGPSLEHR
jgi:hypothetical protein